MKILYWIIWFFLSILSTFATVDLLGDMKPSWAVSITWNWKEPLEQVVIFGKDFILDILYLIVIWVFLFLWAKLIAARWKPDELKNVLMWFVYALIWLAVIPLAYWAVKLISSLNF